MRKRPDREEKSCELQYIFTAYVVRAVRNTRNGYLRRQTRHVRNEQLRKASLLDTTPDFWTEIEKSLPLYMQIENEALLCAIQTLHEQERNIFLAHVLDGEDYRSLAQKYDLDYAAVTRTYYRAVSKIKKKMGVQ